MKEADLTDEMAQDAEISKKAAASVYDPCTDVQGPVRKVLKPATHR
jgi:hypothetical protein